MLSNLAGWFGFCVKASHTPPNKKIPADKRTIALSDLGGFVGPRPSGRAAVVSAGRSFRTGRSGGAGGGLGAGVAGWVVSAGRSFRTGRSGETGRGLGAGVAGWVVSAGRSFRTGLSGESGRGLGTGAAGWVAAAGRSFCIGRSGVTGCRFGAGLAGWSTALDCRPAGGLRGGWALDGRSLRGTPADGGRAVGLVLFSGIGGCDCARGSALRTCGAAGWFVRNVSSVALSSGRPGFLSNCCCWVRNETGGGGGAAFATTVCWRICAGGRATGPAVGGRATMLSGRGATAAVLPTTCACEAARADPIVASRPTGRAETKVCWGTAVTAPCTF